MDPSIINPGATTAAIDQEKAAIREWLDKDGPTWAAEMIREPSAYRDGIRLAMADCLCYRSSPDIFLAHCWAWYEISSGE